MDLAACVADGADKTLSADNIERLSHKPEEKEEKHNVTEAVGEGEIFPVRSNCKPIHAKTSRTDPNAETPATYWKSSGLLP
jgi:hypothetical protein